MRNSAAIRGAVCAGLGLLFAATLGVGSASAQIHSWVSKASNSSDANPCSRTAPCYTFAGAYSKTATGGQIDVIDPGDYGALTIAKPITIDGGGMGTVVSNTGTLFVIAAGATDVVTIRNVTLQGVQAATGGIQIMSAGRVDIDHVVANQFTNFGIQDLRSNSGFLSVSDSIVRNNANGIWMQPSGGSINAVIRNVEATSNSNTGIAAMGVTFASIRDSTAAGNGVGIAALAGAEINVENCGLYSNTTGLGNGFFAAATTRLSNSTVQENTNGVQNLNGSLLTYGNNRIGGAPQVNSAMTPASPPVE
jgi:hypothetical protein